MERHVYGYSIVYTDTDPPNIFDVTGQYCFMVKLTELGTPYINIYQVTKPNNRYIFTEQETHITLDKL